MASTEPEKITPPAEAPPPPEEPEKIAPPVEAPPPEAAVLELEMTAPPPEIKAPADVPPTNLFVVVDVVLRLLLFASALVAVVVMVTSKQTKTVQIPGFPISVSRPAQFDHSPAFIYFVAALSVAGLYSIITTLLSFFALVKPDCSTKLLVHFVIVDVLMLGIVASATGAAGGVAYIGLKGNSHVGWNKVCNVYDKFCQHVGGSVAVSLFASIVLVLLILLSVYTLSKKIPQ